MATDKQLPERYPVIEHMEQRLARQESRKPASMSTSTDGPSALGAFAVGMAVGGLILVVLAVGTRL